jgi:uncharacterized small protein (DUF1192 family)
MDEHQLASLIEASAAETRRHFDVATEELKREIQIAAEGLAHLGTRLDREVGNLREEVNRGFIETQAMIKFSYAELDRRVALLEANLSRLERLEARVQEIESRQ